MGSCDCNKDKDEAGEDAADNANNAIGGGDSVGDASSGEGGFGGDTGASGGEGGGIGEGLVTEAMTPLQKMQALEAGTRGFNASAANDIKLLDNLLLCAQNNLAKAGAVMLKEIMIRMNNGT